MPVKIRRASVLFDGAGFDCIQLHSIKRGYMQMHANADIQRFPEGPDLCALKRSLQGAGKLIRAGGGLEAAGIAFEKVNQVLSILAFHQFADAFQVAVAAADKGYIVNFSIFQIEMNF